MPSSAAFLQDIPVYALYGEAEGAALPRGVHAETIHSRSSGLGWRIAPHRHSTLYQALLITEGFASAATEDGRVDLPARSLAWVPPLCVHAYDFTPGTDGIVVSLPAPLLVEALAHAPSSLSRLGRFVTLAGPIDPEEWEEAEFLARTLLRDHQRIEPGREAALAARAALLALWTARQARHSAGVAGHADRPVTAAARRFLDAVETSFGDPRPLPDYARQVGVSLAHLNRVCRAVTGRSPARLLQDRRLIEAKRLLTYTALPVGQVAYRLGFLDAAYFSRFFRQRTGASPLAFRRLADEAAGPDVPVAPGTVDAPVYHAPGA